MSSRGPDRRQPPPTEAALVAALLCPVAYSPSVDSIELRRTHLSLVFLAGRRAYKVKRAVALGFVDFTTLAARRRACDEEIRLNRRLAPEVYLGVSAIVRAEDGGLRVVDGELPKGDEVVEWAVRMTRVDDGRMLDHLLATDAVTMAELDALADLVSSFLAERPAAGDDATFGSSDAVGDKFLSHLDRMAESSDGGAALHPPWAVTRLRSWSDAWLREHRSLLDRRAADGHVREGHGDLHTANIALVDGRWIVLDCVEFRRDFRCLDSAAESAVLTLDIAHRGDPERARHVHDRIAGRLEPETPRTELATLRRGYAVHYAAVRSHVGALRARELDDSGARADAALLARAYLHHALGLTLPSVLVALCGLPGSGKSVVAAAVARAIEATTLSSDLVRKGLAGIAPADRSGRAPATAIYGPEMTARVLDALRSRAETALSGGHSVVIDATNARRDWRDALAAVAERNGASAWLVWLDVPDAVVRERLRKRAHDPSQPSDADETVYERFVATFEPPTEWPSDRLVRVREGQTVDATVEALLVAACGAPPDGP